MAGSGWLDMTLGDFISLQRGHDLTASERQPGTVPVMGSAGIAGYHNAALARGPGVSIGRSGVGSMGVVSFSPADYWPHNTVLYVTDFHGNDEKFAYYFLQHLNLRRFDSGSAQASLNRNYVYPLPIRVPQPSEQRAIAQILGTLDDKIELNRRMNETLEAMARAIFTSWFVDFDPVRAKMDGRKPEGVDSVTAKLFPNEFEESELGPMPKGWSIAPVGEVVKAVGGGTPSTKEARYWEGGTNHWATPKDLSPLDSPVLLDTERKITDEGVAVISSGLLPAGTLLLSSRALIGYLAIAQPPVAINQGFIAILGTEQASVYFMLNWCRENMDEIERRASGTTFQEISKQNFRPIPMIVPSQALMRTFTRTVGLFYDRMVSNLRESLFLSRVRDALLPKLMSGEIGTAQVEKAVK